MLRFIDFQFFYPKSFKTPPSLFYLTLLAIFFANSIAVASPSSPLSKSAPDSVATRTNQLVSDELVQDLSCQNLNKETLLLSLKTQEAFSPLRHISVPNWSYDAGLYNLANCWSLSHGQRILFYLGRTGLSSNENTLQQTLNMIRRWLPEGLIQKSFHLIPWTPATLAELQEGFTQETEQGFFERNFKQDTEAYQTRRFHQILKNIEYVTKPRERTKRVNKRSLAQLLENLKTHRLTSVLLRPALKMQHVVLAKRAIQRPTGEIDFFVYDSNFPQKENSFYYDPQTEHFYAPEIVGPLHVQDPEKPVGLFIVDEEDREKMLDVLVKHYQTQCHNTKDSAWANAY